MIKVTVFWQFDTKEQFLSFTDNIINHDDLLGYCKTLEYVINDNHLKDLSYKEVWNKIKAKRDLDDGLTRIHLLNCFSITTQSRKVLAKVNDWIKEHHYEKNYNLWGCSGKLNCEIDELIEA